MPPRGGRAKKDRRGCAASAVHFGPLGEAGLKLRLIGQSLLRSVPVVNDELPKHLIGRRLSGRLRFSLYNHKLVVSRRMTAHQPTEETY